MDVILKHALANAHRYGKADFKAVVSKVFGEQPELKKNARAVVEKVRKVVGEVNRMSARTVEKKLLELAPELLHKEKREEVKELPPLEGVEDGVKLRLPPEPNGYLHMGHALSFYLNYLYASRYEGKLVLKFEDTNPLKEKKEYYRAIERDIEWLGIKWDEKFVLSEHFRELRKGAEKLIELGRAYVCTCPGEEASKGRRELKADPCRNNDKAKNMELWEEMLAGGRFVLRWKGDPKAKNSVLRDPTLYRVLDVKHPWTGENHVVYPTYDFASAVTDGLLGITHVLRSEEFLMRAELHRAIISSLGMKPPVYVHYGRFEMEGTPTSKRLIRPLVEDGKVEGWDDPRLATLMALRRRGIHPKTFEDLAKATGPYLGKSTITWELLLGLNRKNIDPIAGRFFVVVDPVELKLDGPEVVAKLPLHPEAKGERKVKLAKRVFIDRSDYKDGKTLRLKGAYNIRIEKKRAVYAGNELIRPIVHWVSDPAEATLVVAGKLFGNGKLQKVKRKRVLAERGLGSYKGEFVQMERVGFARIDRRRPLELIFISD